MSDEKHFHSPFKLWALLKPLARQMRAEPTPAEHKLWQSLRGRRLKGAKFRRQYSIDRFMVDFICLESRLIIEVDGDIHQYTAEEDALRQQFLEARGFKVLRFTNEVVFNQFEAMLESIGEAL